MIFATRARLFHVRLLTMLVAVGGLASSCQSSRPSFSFRPAPGRVRATATHPVLAARDSTAARVAPVASVAQSVAEARGQVKKHPRVRPALPVPVAAATIVRALVERPTAVHQTHRRGLLHRAHPTAEVGLGTTVLGVLGLIALPITIVGLVLSGGGLVWGIVAGAAALAVLVAYIDPFG